MNLKKQEIYVPVWPQKEGCLIATHVNRSFCAVRLEDDIYLEKNELICLPEEELIELMRKSWRASEDYNEHENEKDNYNGTPCGVGSILEDKPNFGRFIKNIFGK